jgi:hypothetical protein
MMILYYTSWTSSRKLGQHHGNTWQGEKMSYLPLCASYHVQKNGQNGNSQPMIKYTSTKMRQKCLLQ